MFFKGITINEEECKRIHDDSIKILEEVGVKVPSERTLEMLGENGAKIDWDGQIAYISRSMVDNALKTAPREFTLGGRNPIFDLHLGPDGTECNGMKGPFINMDGCGNQVLDFTTGKRRRGTLDDLSKIGKIFDMIPEAQILWSCIDPEGVPEGAYEISSSAASMLASGKHLQDEVLKPAEVPYYIELCKAFLGNEQDVIDRKIYGACYCTVAPLTHDPEMLEGTQDLTKYKAPVLLYPMPCNGTTGPASLYSNMAIANAETLSSLVIFQLFSPGTPLIYGAALGRMNVRTGFFDEGAVETGLQMAGLCHMGKYYGFPTEMAGCLTDAGYLGEQAMMQKMFTSLPLMMIGCDIIQGAGLLEGSMTLSYEQMLVDIEMFKQARRVLQGIDVSDVKDYFEDIKSVGPGGDFLRCKNTRKAFRTPEFYNPELVPWQAHDRWVKDGSKGMYVLAHEKLEQMLAADQVSPVDANTEKVVREIVAEAEAKL